MAKGRAAGVPNRHLYARASFLCQAAALLATSSAKEGERDGGAMTDAVRRAEGPLLQGMSRRMANDMRAISLKTQMRMSPGLKRTVCKFCDALLVEGETSTSAIENKSKGGRKPWADVLIIRCSTCGGEKRFPVESRRQPRKPHRPRNLLMQETSKDGEKPTVDDTTGIFLGAKDGFRPGVTASQRQPCASPGHGHSPTATRLRRSN